ncbi:MAG: NAD(P)/FAD-dependent oxidoreductase [Lachnospiraceae bacterium]|nr:NAD(P)/FAD-dependent oxidoreductase [Lachnospiraceae bacterium]
MSKVIIIGGGASGMLAAIGAAENYNEVHIYEKNEKLGKKIYITGKGRCNLTNASDMETIMKNIVTNSKFMYSAFRNFTNEDIVSILNEAGIDTKVERGNRVFPVSDKSSDVIYGLKKKLDELGVKVHLNTEIESLCISDGYVTGVKIKNEGIVASDCVIVATGGYSYQTTGSDGAGYRFAKEAGHEVTDIIPALVPLETRERYPKDIMGLALKNIRADIYVDDKIVYSDFGELLFTHFGLSGPVILSGSSYVTKPLSEGKKVSVIIDMKPALDFDALDKRILRDFSENINKDFRNSLNDLLPKNIIPIVIDESGISPYKKVNEITKEERKKLTETIKGLKLHIKGTRDFNEAIITQGGVKVDGIKPKNMESKLVNGLFFVGEVLDVDALTGGYNLQVAWSSGYAAGKSIY